MKQTIRLGIVLVVLLSQLVGSAAPVRAASLDPTMDGQALAAAMVENFEYGGTPGNLVDLTPNWVVHSGGTTNSIGYSTTSLSIPGYASSGIGGSATFIASGQDINRTFAEQSAGFIYYAALVNLSAATATGDYFLHFKDTGTFNFRGRLFAKSSSGNLLFGLSASSSTATYATINYSFNTTYLAVVKYDILNDDSWLYILDGCSSTEPGEPLLFVDMAASSAVMSAMAIRQGTNSPGGTVDGIRVADNWAEAVQCIAGGPELSITKAASPDTNVAYHGEITYTVTLSNTGVSADPGVLFTDTLPVEVDFTRWVNQPAGAVVSGDEITWSGAVAVGEVVPFSFVVTHTGAYGDIVTNTAEYHGTGSAGSAEAIYTVQDILALAKFCPPSPVDPGQIMEYTLSYELGDGPVSNVIITDVLPADVTYLSDSSGVTPAQPVTGTLVWDLGTVPASGSFIVTGTLSANPVNFAQVNQAWINGDSDVLPGNNYASCSNDRTGLVSIYNIQYTPVPGADGTYPSPFATQEVTTTGTVCAVVGSYFILTEAPGAWHSLVVYNGSQTKPPVGTRVMINGTVTEYYGLTEFSYPAIMSMGSGDPVCDYTQVDTLAAPYNNALKSEPYEAVLVKYPLITITQNTWTGRNTFTDAAAGTGKWGDWGYFPTPRPAVGTQFEFVRGPLGYTYDEYRVMPASAADAPLLDITPPAVISTDPSNGATGTNPHKPVFATFSEAIDPATLHTGTFILTGPGGDVGGAVSYDPATFTAAFTPYGPLLESMPYSARLTTGVTDLTGNPLVSEFLWSFTTGGYDLTPPTILAQFPAPGALDAPLSANLVITFSEELQPGSVIAANFTLVGPYGNVPWDGLTYDSALHKVTLNPSGLLLPTTEYSVQVSEAVVDWAGLPVPAAQRSWSFTTQAEPPMLAYHGDIHSHTSYSDGSGTPQQAFTKGQQCGLEFMAISDHSYAIDDGEWLDTLTQAEAFYDPGTFVTLRGFEYTQGGEGHANVYNSVRHAVRTDTTSTCTYCDYTPNFEKGVTVDGFYNWLAITGTVALDGNGTLMQFNHPGWINFNDWKYHPEVENLAQLEEVGNGWGSSYVFSWDEFIRSLDYGWQVGATNNTDNHTSEWGCIGPNRTGVVMAELSREALMEALQARRTFATEDANAELFFKANGYWMGSEIPNTGSLNFIASGSDPDGELIASVELVTAGGQVVASLEPNASSFDWQFTLPIAPGTHYYLVLVTEADGDRVVSSPVWTEGVEDVRITDLTIQPSLPTIYNPSLVSARITNRGQSAQTLTVSFQADGVVVASVPVTVDPCLMGPCSDAFATISWQPTFTGTVNLLATLEGAPANDNPDDNNRTMTLEVTDEHIPLVLIDTGHNNIGVDPHGISQFVDDLTLHGYNVLFNLDEITASDLSTETVRLLILNAYGPDQLATSELQAISDFVAAGGSLWLNSMSDYTGKVYWAHNLAPRLNGLIAAIETRAGELIPIRYNDDEVLDGDDNNGYPWGVLWHNFPVSSTTGVGMNVVQMQSWSDSSLMDRNGDALTESDLGPNGFMMVLGDQDPGFGTYGEANRTHNTDAEGSGYPTNDAYIYPAGINLPAGAGYDLAGDAGRILFYTDANDPFNVFAYVSGDGKQNELFNLEAVMWLLGEPLHLQTVAEARFDPELDDTPETLDRLVWVEGTVTAGYGEFFDVLYVQDDTGGITVFAPAGTASGAVEPAFDRGDCVRVVGTVDVYQGDTEIEFFETEQIHVLQAECIPPAEVSLGGSLPLSLSTLAASQEINEGWLVVVTGTVTAISGVDTAWLDDGSGPVRLFLDGYNGTWEDLSVGERITVAGMVSEDGLGQRIRVRNHNMHPALPDDIKKLPQIYKSVTPTLDVPLGGVVTYTLTLSNPTAIEATGVALVDVLPAEVDFQAWVQQNGAQVANDVITWNGTLAAGSEVSILFRALLGTDPGYYGTTVTNSAAFTSANAGGSSAQASFEIEPEPLAPNLALVKSVTPVLDVPLGSTVTYTLTLVNSGNGAALGVLLTDILPAEVDFGEWVVQNGASVAGDVITWEGVVPANNSEEFVFTALVSDDPANYGQTVLNVATYDSNNAGTGSAEASFTIEPEPLIPNLEVAKIVEPAVDVPLGSLVTYTISLYNTGNGTAQGILLSDVLPGEVDFAYWVIQHGAQVVNDVITWEGELGAGSDFPIVFAAQVSDDPAYYGQTVTNTVSFTSDNGGTGSDVALFVIEAEPLVPVLALTKAAMPVTGVPLGGVVTYTLTFENSGNGEALEVALIDPLPAEVDFGEWIVQNGATVVNDVITWEGNVPAFSTEAVQFTVVVGDDPAYYGQTITNTATYASANAGSGQDSAVFTVGAAPSILFSKQGTAPEIILPGGLVTYTLTLQNIGAASALGLLLTDTLPTELDFAYWVAQNGAAVSADMVTWSGEIAAGASLEVSFAVLVHADPALLGQMITNRAYFASSNAGAGEAAVAFTVVGETSLTLDKTVTPGEDLVPGGLVTYTLTLSAQPGADPAVGILLEDILPAEVDFVEWIEQNGAVIVEDAITWAGTILAGESESFSFTAEVREASSPVVTNTATFSSGNAGQGEASASFSLAQPAELSLVKAVTPAEEVPLGGVVTYTITVTNTGNGEALGIVLTDVLPAAVTFGGWVSQPAGAIAAGNVLTYTGSLAAGSEVALVFTAMVSSDPAYSGHTVINTAVFTSENTGTGTVSATFTIAAEPPVYKAFLPTIFRGYFRP